MGISFLAQSLEPFDKWFVEMGTLESDSLPSSYEVMAGGFASAQPTRP